MNRCTGRERKKPVWPPVVPLDLGSAPVLPEPGDLVAWVHQPVGDAGVEEAALHRYAGCQGQRRDNPADGLGQPQCLTGGIVAAEAGMAADQFDQIDGWDAQNRAGEAVVEAGDGRREEAAEGEAVQPDHGVGLL
jgi:hypothetical protein